MAQRVQVVLIDDVDGSTADETVRFGLDGVQYELDLSAGNAAELRAAFAKWIEPARKSGGRRAGRKTARSAATAKEEATQIREWARANGHVVSERGRIPAEVRAAYAAAN